MNFQLFKTAAFDNTVTLPRVGFLSGVLRSLVAPLYAFHDEKHPELEFLARSLADHFAGVSPETRLFLSLRSRDPYELVNKKLLSFKMSQLRAFADGIENPSVELSDDNIRKLVDLVMHEAVFLAWEEFLRSNPRAALLAGAEGLAPSELVKTAAKKKNAPAIAEAEGGTEGGAAQPGRLKRRTGGKVYSLRAPTISQGRDETAVLAYEALHNALVISSLLEGTQYHKADTVRMFKERSLSLLIHHVDQVDEIDNFIAAVAEQCASNQQRPIINGLPLVSDPPMGDILGSDFSRWVSSSAVGDDEDDKKHHPAGFVSAMALGVDANTRSDAAEIGLQKRRTILGEEAAGPSIILGTGRAAIGAHKRLASAFSSEPDKLKSGINGIVVAGLNAKIRAMKINGVPTAPWIGIIPALSYPDKKQKADAALGRILGSIDGNFSSLEEAAQICSAVVDREAASADLSKIPASEWVTKKGHPTKELGTSFLHFLASTILGLPIKLASLWKNMGITEALAPIPKLDVSREVKVGNETLTVKQLASLLGTSTVADKASRTPVAEQDAIVNLFSHSTVSTSDLFIASFDYLKGTDEPVEADLAAQEEKKRKLQEGPEYKGRDEAIKAIDSKIKSAKRSLAAPRIIRAREDVVQKIKQAVENARGAISTQLKASKQPGAVEGIDSIRLYGWTMSADTAQALLELPREDFSAAVFASLIMSFDSTSLPQADLQAMCKKIIASNGKPYEGEELKDFAELFAKAIPPNFNRQRPQQVASDFLGSPKKYQNALRSEEVTGEKDADVLANLGTGLDRIQTGTADASATWFMHRASNIALVKNLLSEHIAVTLDDNEKKIKKEIEDHVAADPDSGLSKSLKKDIDSKIEELDRTGIMGQHGFEIEPQADDLEKSKSKADNPEQAVVLTKVNRFLRTNSKGSIIAELQRRGFDETYYDAFLTLISRKIGDQFGEMLEKNALTRYSAKKEMTQSLGAGGEVSVDADESESDGSGAAKGPSESAEAQKIIGSDEIKSFVSKWYTYPVYDSKGNIGAQSLTGFLASAMHKADLAQKGDAKAKEYIEYITKDPDARTGNVRTHPLSMMMKHSVRNAVGVELFLSPARKNLATIISYNKASGSDITSHAKVAADIGLLADPIRAAENLAAGDRRGDTYRRAFERMLMKAGHMKVDNYDIWKAGMVQELQVFRKQQIARIDSLLARSIITASSKSMLITILDRKFNGSAPFDATYLSAEEADALLVIGKAISAQLVPAVDDILRETIASPEFEAAARNAKDDVQAIVKDIDSNTTKVYSRFLQQKLDAAGFPAVDVSLDEKIKAIMEVRNMRKLPAKNKARNEFEKNLPILRASQDRLISSIIKTDAFRSTITQWASEREDATKDLVAAADFGSKVAEARMVGAAFRIAIKQELGEDAESSFMDASGGYSSLFAREDFGTIVNLLVDSIGAYWADITRTSPQAEQLLKKKLNSTAVAADAASVESEGLLRVQQLAQFADGARLGDAISDATRGLPQLKMFMQTILADKSSLVLRGGRALAQTRQMLADVASLFAENSPEVEGVAKAARGSETDTGREQNLRRYRRLAGDAVGVLEVISEQVAVASASADEMQEASSVTSSITGSAAHNEMLQLEDALRAARLPQSHAFSTYKRTYAMHAAHVADIAQKYAKAVEQNYSSMFEAQELLKASGKTIETATPEELERVFRQVASGSTVGPQLDAKVREIKTSPLEFLSMNPGLIEVVQGRFNRGQIEEVLLGAGFPQQLSSALADFAVQDVGSLRSVLVGRPGVYARVNKWIDSQKGTPEERRTSIKNKVAKTMDTHLSEVIAANANSLARRALDLPEEEEEADDVDSRRIAAQVEFAKTKGVEIFKNIAVYEAKVQETARLAAEAAKGRDVVSEEFRRGFAEAQKQRELAEKISPADDIVNSSEITIEEDEVVTSEETEQKRKVRTEIVNFCTSFMRRDLGNNIDKVFRDFISALLAQINDESVLDRLEVSDLITLNTDYILRLKNVKANARSANDAGTMLVALSKDIERVVFKNTASINFSPAAEKAESRFESELDKVLARMNAKIDDTLSKPGVSSAEDDDMSPAEKGLENIRLSLNSISQDKRQINGERLDEKGVMSVLADIEKLITPATAERATPAIMKTLMDKLGPFGLSSNEPGVGYYEIGVPLVIPDPSSFQAAVDQLESEVKQAKLGASPGAADEYLALESLVRAYSEGMYQFARSADVAAATSLLSSLLPGISAGSKMDEKQISEIHSKLADMGVITKAPTAPHVVEIHDAPRVEPIVEEVEPLMEVEPDWPYEETSAGTEPATPPDEVAVDKGSVEPTADGIVEISEGDFEEIPETSGTEIPEISDEEVEEVQPPLPAPEPAAQPAEPLMEVQPGTLTPAPAGPAPVSKEAAIILNRIVEEVDAANSTLAAAGVAGPVHESLTGIKSRLTAAMASGSISDDLNKLAEVLGQAIALTDEVSTGDPSAFATIAPPAMADLLEGVSHIIMPKKASSRPPAFIRNGDSWTVLM